MTRETTLSRLRRELRKRSSRKYAASLRRFFKTGPGEYGEKDVFIGVRVPRIRSAVSEFKGISLSDTARLLRSRIHEERLAALIILSSKFRSSAEDGRKKIFNVYLSNTRYINNWDLVDLSAPGIAGAFLLNKSRKVLYSLASSGSMWERRIAVLATFRFIAKDDFRDSLKIGEMLLDDEEDLIHKAVGWMLREIGKRNLAVEEKFLRKHRRKCRGPC